LEELKLFVVTFKGPDPCFKLQVARNAEEAFLSCFNKHTSREGHEKASCTVTEAAVAGYEITVTPARGEE
jgi:hypothetical protein